MSWRNRRKIRRQKSRLTQPHDLTRHHRRPKSLNGTDSFPPNNISLIPDLQHRSWHNLFGSMSPYQIARLITELYLDPDYIMVAVKRSEHS